MIDLKKMSKLWKKGLTMTHIGLEMGLTRGQVSGRISRNRAMFPPRIDAIKRLDAEIAGELIESIAEDKKAKARTSNELRKLFSEATKPAQPIPSKAENKAYDEERLASAYTLLDLPSNGCKFPLLETVKGETQMFCGERRYQMKPWCAAHHARVWRAA